MTQFEIIFSFDQKNHKRMATGFIKKAESGFSFRHIFVMVRIFSSLFWFVDKHVRCMLMLAGELLFGGRYCLLSVIH